MIDSLYIAWKYLAFYRWRTATLVAAITLIAVLPLTLEVLLNESERQLLSRAASTPLLLGAKGSSLDLVMNSLYFDDEVPETISMAADEEVLATELAAPIPLYVRFEARGFPIVGTTLDYFDFRKLSLGQGRPLAMLGECVVGATVAQRLGLVPKNQPTQRFAQMFWNNLNKKGRVNELKLGLSLYFMNGFGEGVKTSLKMKDIGLGMLKTKRMTINEAFGGHGVKDLSGFQKIMNKAHELEDARIQKGGN